MRERPDDASSDPEEKHSALPSPRNHGGRVRRLTGQPEDDDVRLHCAQVERDAWASRQAFRDPPGIRMVLGEDSPRPAPAASSRAGPRRLGPASNLVIGR
jgi:hypothetical protein